MKISKWSLGSIGIFATTAGTAYTIIYLADKHLGAELDVLAFVFLAIGIICFSLCRSKHIPKYAKEEWMMALQLFLPLIKFFLFFLAIQTDYSEKLFPIGISFIVDFPLMIIRDNIRQKQQKENAKAQTRGVANPQVTKTTSELKAERIEEVDEHPAVSTEKTAEENPSKVAAEQPAAAKEGVKPDSEKIEESSQCTDPNPKKPTDPELRSDEPMQECRYEKAGLIAQAFELNKIKFYVIEGKELEVVCAAFQIKNGPSVNACFFVEKEGCIHMRVSNVITDIPEGKRLRMLEACNILNVKLRFFKFSLNKDNTISLTLDFLETTPKEALGTMACEAFLRSMHVLNNEYGTFMKAFYTDETLDM